ncbi:MAG TPA: beta-glucosidase BglX [Terriglobales bacterium]|jgi:beta-glucosidase|nr:beta-glucosidase BglX [Terriglobales bacterium]
MFYFRQTLLCCILLFSFSLTSLAQQFSDPQIEQRVNALLRKMTLEEKAGQITQLAGMNAHTAEMIKQGKVGSILGVLGAENVNEAQRAAVENSRLKIPLIIGYDVIHGYRTVFPVPLASAGSFDPQLIEQSERVAAKEASASGVKWTFAPMVDIARDPRWGRIVEGAGEDPYLGSVVAAARVRGFQGNNIADPESVVACAKHYVAYGAVEGGRDYNTVDISEELLREVYLPPFHAAVDAGVGTLMSAFNDLNGVPATANHHTLTDILRDEWKFDGFVVSDYNSIHELIAHGVAADDSQASLEALSAGVDMDMADDDYERFIPDLVKSGKLPESVVDEAVRRVLRVKFKAGLFEHPYTDPAREKTDILTADSLQIERKMAQESMVLLQNNNDLLPLKKAQTVAVIGPLADDKASQLGSWAGNGQAKDAVTPLEGIVTKLGKEHVLYAKGVDIPPFEKGLAAGVAAPAPTSATGAAGVETSNKAATIEDAVSAANKADTVILFVGELAGMTGEASSRASLELPGDQMKLISAVLATKKPVVLVLESGRPLNISWAPGHVQAIMQAWFLGVQAGNAIADVLFGDASPSARLPLSWPRSVGQIPIYYNHKNTGRPSAPDRWHTGYLDLSNEPLYPFGYGLTYTKFKYSNVSVKSGIVRSITFGGKEGVRGVAGSLHVTAEIENTGKREGTEVVQLYVHDRVAPTSRPVRELKGFQRVTLAPGEHKNVEFTVQANDLGSYDPDMHWIVPAGTYDVWVAPDSASGVAGTFEVQ